ncbi:MAG: stalk domain-containing protein, partial [Defluviitaleaceae bacterium]|nr:stalk domain-containing protein [Defluviitaleaceae bacterium]
MKYIRHMMLYALGACLLIGNPTHAARASNGDIRLYINGREITGLPVPPVIHQNSALVPAREVFETLGAFVEWNAAEQKVLINYESELLVMKIGDVNAQLNGADVVMQIPPLLVEGKTMIPLRFPAECFDFEVSWNEAERAAYIYAPPKPAAKPEEVLYDEDGFDEDADSGDGAPEEEVSGDAESDADGFGDGSDAVIIEQETDYIDESERARDVSQAEISAMEYDEASIIEFLTPKETSSTLYVAVASSPISNVTRFLLPDNRLVVDIHNSSCEIYGPFFMDETVPLDDIRASQFSKEPMTTRIVFEISGAAEFAISLSEDRTELTVSFGKTTVADVSFSTNGISDTITITSAGTNAPTVRLVPGTDPTRVDIIIENAEMDFTIYENTSGAFVTRLSSFKREGGAICVEARLNSFPSFRLEYGQDSVSIILYPNTYQNIWYRQANRTIYITKTPLFNMDVFQIQHQDDYHELRYTLT